MEAYKLLNRLNKLTLVEGKFGEDIFVGTDQEWTAVMWADDGVPEHDCHLSPEDGCNCQN